MTLRYSFAHERAATSAFPLLTQSNVVAYRELIVIHRNLQRPLAPFRVPSPYHLMACIDSSPTSTLKPVP